MLKRVLVANRGEIAARLIRACHAVGAEAVAVYSEADTGAAFLAGADATVLLGPPPPTESYLKVDAVLRAAADTGADAVHPGYGFLSENPAFAEAVEAAGLTWVGPPPGAMRAMADKIDARNLVAAAGVPVVPGTAAPVDAERALAEANRIGFPLMVKAAKGGGGIGMTVVTTRPSWWPPSRPQPPARGAAFGDASVFLERYVEEPRHIEVQVLGEADGRVFHLFERECSVQRRHQKVIEETPSMALDAATREELCAAAVRAAEAVGYRSAGTVEFIYGQAASFYFLEMNTRLQVEHPITEATLGVDLAAAQLRIAAAAQRYRTAAAASRPRHRVPHLRRGPRPLPALAGGDHGLGAAGRGGHPGGQRGRRRLPRHPLLRPAAGQADRQRRDREQAMARAGAALHAFKVEGVKNNIPTHLEVLASPEFRSGGYDTGLLALLSERRKAAASAG